MKQQKILLCMGTRPEIIKMAPIYHELKACNIETLLLHTGQHQDMADPMYGFFKIVPDFSLQLPRTSDNLFHLSALLLEQIGRALLDIKPTVVLVHGDTSSAAMAALASFYQQIPVGHVEAGLRSHQDYDPFPEEKNREIIGRLARWHFAPTEQAKHNLLLENIPENRIHKVGNTIVDAVRLSDTQFKESVDQGSELEQGALKTLAAQSRDRRLILVTAHRRENLGAPLLSIAASVRELLQSEDDIVVVWPVHSNPKVRDTVHAVLKDLAPQYAKRLYLTKPLSYPSLVKLLQQAWLVLTDSGGIQEESACMQLPVMILRETTERPELIESGGGILIGTEQSIIVNQVRRLLHDSAAHSAMCDAKNPFGDGFAAARIRDILALSKHA
jgi:UDP-N-acetylglucosamine 2-epimerase (non-hydrolysing)